MNDLGLGPRSKHRKCAKIVGDTSGNYHPHGDQATYGTLVRLGQEWNMRVMLVDPQGNFGSVDNDPPAAMRYTEARMTAAAVDMLEDLKLDTVDFAPNYDETRTEPTVLPGKFPNLLVNGASGIAVGMATNLPPHNVGEVCDALLLVIDDPNCGFKDIMEKLPGPDFPTGGIICGRKGIVDAYVNGRGHLRVRCKAHVEAPKKGRENIVITEIPYMTVKSAIVSKIADCVHDGSIEEIADVRDESDRHGMRIVVELKKDADYQVVINKLYRFTQLQTTFAVQNVALVNNRPETLNIRQMLQYYIDHRLIVIQRRTKHQLKKFRQRAHILEGLILAVSDIDEIIDLIKASPDAPTAKERLMKKPLRLAESATLKKILPESFLAEKTKTDQFLTSQQADAILTMQLQRLTGLEIEILAKEFAEISNEIAEHEALLASRKMQLDVIRKDLEEIKKKFATPRRTELAGEEAEDINMSKNGWIGRYLEPLGIKAAFSPLGVAIALTSIGLPFIVRTLQTALEELDGESEEAAASLGATRGQTFWRVTLPSVMPAQITGFALAFARALGKYGSVVFISGNMPLKTEITSLLIITKLEQYDYAGATAIAVVMLLASFVLLLAINLLQRWVSASGRKGI